MSSSGLFVLSAIAAIIVLCIIQVVRLRSSPPKHVKASLIYCFCSTLMIVAAVAVVDFERQREIWRLRQTIYTAVKVHQSGDLKVIDASFKEYTADLKRGVKVQDAINDLLKNLMKSDVMYRR